MRVAIINITGGGMSSGYKKYLCNIIPRMAVHPEVEAILCVSPAALNVEDWFGSVSNVEFIGCKPLGLVSNKIGPELKIHLERFSPDVIFVPTERRFCFDKTPIVNMLQNMEPLVGVAGGNPFFEQVQHWFRVRLAKQAILKANRVIAISKFVKEYLINKCNVPKDKIGLIYYGSDELKINDAKRPLVLPADWDREFIFTAGSIRPTRGLEDIFLALHYLNKENKRSLKLVIAGVPNLNMVAYQNKLKHLTEKLNISDKVCWANHLDNNEMAWCYQNCRLFIMSSRVESFGQIALEAMSYGSICISTDNPCLPELFEDAAIYYSPKDCQSLAKSVTSVLHWDSGQIEEMAIRARNRAAMFSWDVCAMKTVAELVKAINNRLKTNEK